MNSDRIYKFNEFNELINESANEFKPKIGSKVIRDNAETNAKSVKDIMTDTEKYNPKTDEKRNDNSQNEIDYNKSTLDLNFDYEPSKEYKERVKSQVKGFPSVDNEKNSDVKNNESLDTEGNKDFYKKRSESSKKNNDKEQEEKHSGLKSHNKSKDEFKNNSLFTEKKMKRLYFKNTVFLSEAQMLRHIPEDYKKDGNKFVMKDSTNTEYIVECKIDERFKFTQFKVLNKINRENVNEEINRIKDLYNYNSSEYFTNSNINENKELGEIVKKVKKMKK